MNKKLEIAQWLLDPDRKQAMPIGKQALLADLPLLEARLAELGLEKIYHELELPLAPILEEMHQTGIKVDLKLLEKMSGAMTKELAILDEKIYQAAGAPFNINSPQQLSEVLFEKLKISSQRMRRTKTGHISTDENTLALLKDRHPIIELILKYRETFKTKSTYVEPLRKLADKDSRVHTTFAQTGTATGRLSSQNPNLQNVPPVVREAFIAESGYQLASFDYSQIELRVLAFVAEDPKMIEAFQKDLDIHMLTAAQVFNTDIAKVTKEQRQFAKTLNFGVIYGMGANAFALQSGLSHAEAEKFIKEYFSDFAEVKRWQEKTIAKARQLGYVENLNGRKRWLPDITSSNRRFAAAAERAAINMPIQGLAADIIKLAMIKVNDLIFKNKWQSKVRMLLSIHDELLFEIDKKVLNDTVPQIKRMMEAVYKLKVPLKVEAAIGNNWLEMKNA